MFLAVVHRPPDSPDRDFDIVTDKLQEMINDARCPELYVIGDFNLPLFDWIQCAVPDSPPSADYGRFMTNFL